MDRIQRLFLPLLALAAAGALVEGCGVTFYGTPPGAVVGRADAYDYSPSVLQTGAIQQFWWCGQAQNPADHAQASDTIVYETINTITHVASRPAVVLAETPGAWDSAYTCNPRVIRGTFSNPLGDGKTYTYEMFYVGTALFTGVNNSIGAAFSNDGLTWKKYPQPVVLSTSVEAYGVAQPAAYNSDQKSGITLFYEDNTPALHHVRVTSTDGIHFTGPQTLTTKGLAFPDTDWGDIGFDPSTKSWYAAYNLPARNPASTAGVAERGQYGVQLYRIADASRLTGATPWELLKTVDTNLTGDESNFIASFLHDPYGDVTVGAYPTIALYLSASNPQPSWDASPEDAGKSGDISKWDITIASYVPDAPMLALNRYRNGTTYETTTGWTDPAGKFLLDALIAHLYPAPHGAAQTAFYGCKQGKTDYFTSTDGSCGAARILGLQGYGYAMAQPDGQSVALYHCTEPSGDEHFVSKDAGCEGAGAGILLGYALP